MYLGNRISITLYEPCIDIILHSIELYAYNLHFINKKYCDDYALQNLFIKYCYDDILSSYNSQKYNIGYNASYNCDLELQRIKKKKFYKYKKSA